MENRIICFTNGKICIVLIKEKNKPGGMVLGITDNYNLN